MSKKRVLTDYFKPSPKEKGDGGQIEARRRNETARVNPADSSPLPKLFQQSSKVSALTMVPDSEGEEDSEDSLEETIRLWPKPQTTTARNSNKGQSKSRKQIPTTNKPEEPKYIFSLAALVAQKLEDDDRDQAFQRIEARIAKAEDDHVTDEEITGPAAKDVVNEAVGDEQGRRLMDILNRREAWREERVWHFFQDSYPSTRRPFPDERWLHMKEPIYRRQMFLTGYLRDMATMGVRLPDEIISWMLDELCVETREDLCFAYEKTLEGYPSQLSSILSEGMDDCSLPLEANVNALFQLLGGREDAIDIYKQITLQEARGKGRKRINMPNERNIRAVVTLLGNIADYLPESLLCKICGILMRLRIDVKVSYSLDLVFAVEDSLSSCVASFSDDSWVEASLEISKAIVTTFTDPFTRLHLLKSLPVDSPRTHLLRRRLALAFLFDNPEYLERDHRKLLSLSDVVNQLEKPQFQISHATDYGSLKTHLEVLDIAVDDGPSRALPGNHNLAIETLVNKLKLMSTNIVDGTMTSLLRTETKQVLDNLQFRLTYSLERLGKAGQSVLEQHFMNDEWGERLRQAKLNFTKV